MINFKKTVLVIASLVSLNSFGFESKVMEGNKTIINQTQASDMQAIEKAISQVTTSANVTAIAALKFASVGLEIATLKEGEPLAELLKKMSELKLEGAALDNYKKFVVHLLNGITSSGVLASEVDKQVQVSYEATQGKKMSTKDFIACFKV